MILTVAEIRDKTIRNFTIKPICRGSSVVERCPEKAGVASSILALGTIFIFEPASWKLSTCMKQVQSFL